MKNVQDHCADTYATLLRDSKKSWIKEYTMFMYRKFQYRKGDNFHLNRFINSKWFWQKSHQRFSWWIVQAISKICVQKQSPRMSKTLSDNKLKEIALPGEDFLWNISDDGIVASVKRIMEQIRGVRNRFMQMWKRHLPVWQGRSVKKRWTVYRCARTLGYSCGKMWNWSRISQIKK